MNRTIVAGLVRGLMAACAVAALSGSAPADPSASIAQFAYAEFGVSPDGRMLAYPVPAYDSTGEPATEVWVSNADGTNRRRAASLPDVWSVRWRGARDLIAYRFDADRLYVIPAGGGKPRAVAISPDYQWIQPAISPDGRRLAFNAVRKSPRECGVFVQEIGARQARTLNKDVVKSFVDWSPDSRRIAYGIGSYERDYRLTIVDTVTGASQDTGVRGVGARWSPDGKWIAFTGEVASGESWSHGVPTDGRILKMDAATHATVALTEPPTHVRDADTGRSEASGTLDPVWSPDGSRIAYRRARMVRPAKSADTTFEDEIWVMSADGSDRRRVWPKEAPYAWARDGRSIYVKTDTGIARLALRGGAHTTVAAWRVPVRPKLKASDTKTLQMKGARIRYTGITSQYARAILAVTAAARRTYATKFACDMPAEISITALRDPDAQTSLWNDGDRRFSLTVNSVRALAPPAESGVCSIYGLCHEAGHLAMYRRCRPIGLPDGVAEGWADYAGSVVTDEVYAQLGPKVWPTPYDYRADGLARLRKEPREGGDPIAKAAGAFLQAHERYGPARVFAAMNRATSGAPYGKDVMPRFVDALVAITGDASARTIFPTNLLTPTVRWTTAERKITDQTTEGQAAQPDAGGTTLKYDAGKSGGMQSMAGGGHAVIFRRPAGEWALDAIEMYGSRYGTPKPPPESFSIFVCDENFEVVREIRVPYARLTYGDKPAWNHLTFDPVVVPERFYVCVWFNATANRGFYVHYESGHTRKHSRSALPWTYVSDMAGDWMIRAHLRPAR